ncbi:MAG: multicopper oxidase domain-containing protein [Gemmatimonadaceae bacterium]|nr:multicopper oxidase domain-containing protein [Gemmatimonadaceae bacterium]
MIAAVLRVMLLAQMQVVSQAHAPRVPLPRVAPTAVRTVAQDNRVPAGQLVGTRLTLGMDIVEGAWRPEGKTDPEVPVLAFAESGRAPSVPGPLIRVRQGTTMVLTLRNRTDSALVISGLRPGARPGTDTIRVAAGATRNVEVRFTTPGTFYYQGTFADHPFRVFKDGQLNGAIVVDAPGARTDDYILLLSEWFYPAANSRAAETVTVINGKGWPHTPRLAFTQGDTVRFRVINTIGFNHPMHLHGFYYRLESQGDGRVDTPIPAAKQLLSNTDLIPALGTYTLSFVASRPGNWLYHCHFAFHIDESVTLTGATYEGAPAAPAAAAVSHDHAAMAANEEHMRGLVLGFTVKPRPDYVEPSMAGARTMHLFAQEKPGVLFASGTLQSYVLQQGPKPPAPDSVVFPSSVIELQRGQPVRIMVHNNLQEPTAIHWHGLEIESFPDGVPNFSGYGTRLFTQVSPRDSFAAEFTPPRAGTYPYHTHFNDRGQMLAGLYGALLVTDGPRDLAHDHLVVIGGAGPWVERFFESPYGVVNGSPTPAPLTLTAGETHRLRVVMLHPDWTVTVRLRSESPTAQSTGRWTPIAKDGADLPVALRVPTLAQTRMGPGQTADFTFTPPMPGEWVLDVLADDGGWHAVQRLTVTKPTPRTGARPRPQ